LVINFGPIGGFSDGWEEEEDKREKNKENKKNENSGEVIYMKRVIVAQSLILYKYYLFPCLQY